MSKKIPYRTLWRVVDGNISSFSTQRLSYDNLKENEFLSRVAAEAYLDEKEDISYKSTPRIEREEDLERVADSLANELEDLDDDIGGMVDEINRVSSELVEIDDLRNAYIDHFGSSSSDLDTRYDRLDNELLDLENERDSLDETYKEVEDELDSTMEKLESLRDDNEDEESYFEDEETYYEDDDENFDELQYVITPQNITVTYQGVTHTLNKESSSFQDIVDALINNVEPEMVMDMLDLAEKLKRDTDNLVNTDNGYIEIEGNMVPESLAKGILDAVFENNEGVASALKNFWNKLKKNDNEETIENLFNFMKNRAFGILENGNFLAYKYVDAKLRDVHSGKFDNSPGRVVEMPRDEVDHNNSNTCSHGLHVGAWDYVNSGGAHIVLCEVDPSDVCAVPQDYDFQKMRVSKYLVHKIVTEPVREGVINT